VLRPEGMSKKARLIAAAVAVGALLVGAALLSARTGDTGPAGNGDGLPGTEPSATASAPSAESSGSVIGTSTVIGKDRTQQSVAASKTADAVKLAVDGSELTTVTQPPAKTLSMLSTDTASAGSTYRVTFSVYGFGPNTGSVKTAVILVSKSVVEGEPAKPFDFNGRNVLVRLDPSAAGALTRGGTYSGIITLRQSGDTLVPWLGDVGSGL